MSATPKTGLNLAHRYLGDGSAGAPKPTWVNLPAEVWIALCDYKGWLSDGRPGQRTDLINGSPEGFWTGYDERLAAGWGLTLQSPNGLQPGFGPRAGPCSSVVLQVRDGPWVEFRDGLWVSVPH
jgi:hypothetical protein